MLNYGSSSGRVIELVGVHTYVPAPCSTRQGSNQHTYQPAIHLLHLLTMTETRRKRKQKRKPCSQKLTRPGPRYITYVDKRQRHTCCFLPTLTGAVRCGAPLHNNPNSKSQHHDANKLRPQIQFNSIQFRPSPILPHPIPSIHPNTPSPARLSIAQASTKQEERKKKSVYPSK